MRLHQRLRRDHARHTDDWLITYADTITLLLCLFVVILSIKTTASQTSIAMAPAHYGAAPVSHASVSEDIFGGNPPFAAFTRVAEAAANDATPEKIVDEIDPIAPLPGPVNTATAWAPALFVTDPFAPPATRPVPVAAVLPAVIDRPKAPGAAAEQRSDRITTMQISSAAFFGSGDAALSGPGKSILRDVAVTLKSDRFAGYHVSIEGHTDDSPINTAQFQSNWELSTARAAAVVRFFMEQGIPARKLTAAGYADTFPIAPNRNVDGTVISENQAKNRRVVIKLEKIDRAER